MRLIAWLLSWTPLWLAEIWCWKLAWVWWLVLPIRKRKAVANLRACFPELPPGPTLRRSLREILLGYVELLRHRRAPIEVVYEDIELLVEPARRGEGTLVVAGHGGSWDLVVAAFPKAYQVPVSIYVKPPASPAVAGIIEEIRVDLGLKLLPPDGSMLAGLRDLKRGHVLVFPLDQRRNQGVPVPFFGRPAWTSPALALAAARTGAKVVGVWQWREGLGRHRLRCYPLELSGDRDQDMRTLNGFIEDRIRERPHAWLWLHDRWRQP